MCLTSDSNQVHTVSVLLPWLLTGVLSDKKVSTPHMCDFPCVFIQGVCVSTSRK